MRHIIICQEQALAVWGRLQLSDDGPVLFLVDARSLQRKLSRAGYHALSGDLWDERIYQRAHISANDDVLIQVHDPQLAEHIVRLLWRQPRHPAIAVITENGFQPTFPPPVKHISVRQLVSKAAQAELRRAHNHLRVQQLQATLADIEKLLILVQHDPDPDAIASALALRTILGRNKTTAPIGSFGQVTRPENVAMITLLEIDIEHLTRDKLGQYDGIALVDVQPPYFKDIALPRVDAVIDHHPQVASYPARYRDIRTSFGATSTIFVQYLQAIGAKITQRLATALYYGIKTDTLFLGRETTEADVEAFTYLYPLANHGLIRRMERPKLPLRDLDAFGYALRARTIIDAIFFTHLGLVEREDVLPQFAEFCLQVENIEWSVVSGIFGGNLIVSVRNSGHVKSAGEMVRHAFGHLGSAGGHRSMAKAVIPLAVLEQQFGRLSDAQLGQFIQEQVMQSLGVPTAV